MKAPKFHTSSTGSPSQRRRKNSTTFSSSISTPPTVPTSPQQRATGTHFPRWAKIHNEKFVKQQRRSVFTTCLSPSSSAGMFIVTWRHFPFLCMHDTRSWCSAGLAHHTQRLNRGARDVLRVEVDCEGTRCGLLLVRRWRDYESTFCHRRKQWASRFVFLPLFLFCICGMRSRETRQQQQKRPRTGGAGATLAIFELHACPIKCGFYTRLYGT